jgi:hypothetical protein
MRALRPWLIAALALPVVSAPSSGFEIRVEKGLVSIDAHEAPLSEVLDQLGRQTGMKLVYEAGRPHQIVSASIAGLPPPVALTKLLEGLGVGYGFSLDPTGTRVQTLIISGVTASINASLARPGSPAARSLGSDGGPARIEAEADAPQPPDEETPEPTSPPEPEPVVAAPAAKGFGVPGLPNGGPPSFSPFTGSAMQASPAFPGGASAPMPFLPRPVIPPGASSPQPLP